MLNRPAIGTRFLNHNKTKIQELSAFENKYCLIAAAIFLDLQIKILVFFQEPAFELSYHSMGE